MAEKYMSSSSYAYVGNNPINHRDFMGLWSFPVYFDGIYGGEWSGTGDNWAGSSFNGNIPGGSNGEYARIMGGAFGGGGSSSSGGRLRINNPGPLSSYTYNQYNGRNKIGTFLNDLGHWLGAMFSWEKKSGWDDNPYKLVTVTHNTLENRKDNGAKWDYAMSYEDEYIKESSDNGGYYKDQRYYWCTGCMTDNGKKGVYVWQTKYRVTRPSYFINIKPNSNHKIENSTINNYINFFNPQNKKVIDPTIEIYYMQDIFISTAQQYQNQLWDLFPDYIFPKILLKNNQQLRRHIVEIYIEMFYLTY